MKKICLLIFLTSFTALAAPNKKQVLAKMHLANQYFQQKWPNVGQVIVSPDKTETVQYLDSIRLL